MFLNLLSTLGATITVNGKSTTVSDSDFAAAFLAFIGALMLPIIIFGILQIIATWKIFTKCGVAGWKSIIPIYNIIVLMQIVGFNPLWILASLIPFVGGIFSLILTIAINIRIGRGFGKSDGFIVGLVLLSFIFDLILAFDKSTWNPSKINYDSFSFLNGTRPAAASAKGSKSSKKDEWVDGK